MSECTAAEWVAHAQQACALTMEAQTLMRRRPVFMERVDGTHVARVTDDGWCELGISNLNAANARLLAAWLLATFPDKEEQA
jgi:hypothetical protein